MLEFEKNCTLLIHMESGAAPVSVGQLQKQLEDSKDVVKAKALEDTILWMIQGETYTPLLMTVIRYVVPSNDHRVKKLLQIYWEIVDKCKADGSIKDEMILVCNALLNDLQHANEYIRGSTLKLLCKMKYHKIVLPLIDGILKNLQHRHSYVRRNAVMCVFSLVKSFGLEMMPNASEEVENLLLVEGDLSTKRNCFLMLMHCDQEKAFSYILTVQDLVSTLGDVFQLAIFELLRKANYQDSRKSSLLRMVINLLDNCHPAVAYEGAAALVSLSSSNLSLKAAARAYVQLLTSQGDLNVRLIVLNKLKEMISKHSHIIEGFVIDIMRALSCPSLEVKRKCLDIVLQLISLRNVQDVIQALKKEIIKTIQTEPHSSETDQEYRRLLIRAVHAASTRFPEVVHSIIQLLMDFIVEDDNSTTTEVILLLRELSASYPKLRAPILRRIIESLSDMKQSRVSRVSTWLIGEYCEDEDFVGEAITALYNALMPFPIALLDDSKHKDKFRLSDGISDSDNLDKETRDSSHRMTTNTAGQSSSTTTQSKVKVTTRTVILEDGTYGTEDVYLHDEVDLTAADTVKSHNERPPSHLRRLIVERDELLMTSIAVSVTKMICRICRIDENNKLTYPNDIFVKALTIVSFSLKFTVEVCIQNQPTDSAVRCQESLNTLLCIMNNNNVQKFQVLKKYWLETSRKTLMKVLDSEKEAAALEVCSFVTATDEAAEADVSDQLSFRLIKRGSCNYDELDDEADIKNALNASLTDSNSDEIALFQERLAKVQQMTGLADPVYVEAFVQVHQYNLLVELLIVNRTPETLQNVHVELSTHGDLKLVDRPTPVTIQPSQTIMMHASIKVQSTETGIIFGYVTYDKRSAADKECLVLNELHVDLLDYVQRTHIGELSFRSMWSEFEWENKININTTITDVRLFLEHIMKHTNMTLVGKHGKGGTIKSDVELYKMAIKEKPVGSPKLDEEHQALQKLSHSSFIAVNLYSRSIFDEDALANISIERHANGKLAGSVRIRSKTQGVALCLGDRISSIQRGSLGQVKEAASAVSCH